MAAKKEVERESAENLQSYFETGLVDAAGRHGLSEDPKAYGIRASRKVLETIARYVYEQGLSCRQVAVDELFAGSTLDI